MPTNAELNIILRLRDLASKQLREAAAAVKTFQEQMRNASQELRQMSRNMLQVGAVVTGAFALAFREAAQRVPAVRDAVAGLQVQFVQLQSTIAEAALPVLQQAAFAFQRLREALESMDPHLRDQIIRWVFLGGLLALVVGTVGKLTAALLSTANAVFKFGLAFAFAHPIIAVTVLAAIGFISALNAWPQTFTFVTRLIDRLVLSFGALTRGIKAAWAILTGGDAKAAIADLEAFVQKNNEVFQQGGGPVESFGKGAKRFLDDYVNAGRQTADATKAFLDRMKAEWDVFWTSFTDAGKRASEILTGGATDLEARLTSVYRTIIVDGGKAKDAFANFGRAILEMTATMIARFLALITVITIFKAVLGIFTKNPAAAIPIAPPGIQTVHGGGRIPRFQSGGEVPAILESGEFVVRRAVAQRHAGALDTLNRTGELQGEQAPIINQWFINATDANSFRSQMQQNADMVEAMIQRSLRRNSGPMRGSLSLA